MYSVQCTEYSVHCTVYNVQCTVNTVQCTVNTVQCTAYVFTVYSVKCRMYFVHCNVYSVPFNSEGEIGWLHKRINPLGNGEAQDVKNKFLVHPNFSVVVLFNIF